MQLASPIFTPGNGIGNGTSDSKKLIIKANDNSKAILTSLFVFFISTPANPNHYHLNQQ